MVKKHELLHKGSGIKAVFSLAPLPRKPCMGESPCSLGGGVDSSNHQFPRQTDRGQDTEGHHLNAECKKIDISIAISIHLQSKKLFP